MPSNKNAFNRYLILDELLSDRFHDYSIEDLTHILEVRLAKDGFEGVGRRCVEKDIVYLENEPIFAEIERYKSETGKRCVRYADPTFSIFNKKLSNEERSLLCEVLETIGQFDGLDNFEWLEDFKSKLSETDKKILEMRVEGYGLEEIAKATGYKTASAVYKHILKITRAYEDFSNPLPDEGARV